MDDVLVLWDIDGTLLHAGGVGHDLYDAVFLDLFGRSLSAFAPMAGRTDRAIILETLSMAGIEEPRRYVDPFLAGLGTAAGSLGPTLAVKGRALPGAAAALAELGARASARSLAAVGLPSSSAGLAGRVYQSVLTGNVRPLAEAKLGALGLRHGLDLCIGAYGDDHEDRAELVHVARRRAAGVHGWTADAFSGQSTVIIGDTPLDIAAALTAGARAVGVATGSYTAVELVAAGAHDVLADLTDTAAVLAALLPDLDAGRDAGLAAGLDAGLSPGLDAGLEVEPGRAGLAERPGGAGLTVKPGAGVRAGIALTPV